MQSLVQQLPNNTPSQSGGSSTPEDRHGKRGPGSSIGRLTPTTEFPNRVVLDEDGGGKSINGGMSENRCPEAIADSKHHCPAAIADSSQGPTGR